MSLKNLKGDEIKVKVLEIKKEDQNKVELQLGNDPFDWFKDKNVNDIITVEVISSDNKGLVVKPESCELNFLIKKSNIAVNNSDTECIKICWSEKLTWHSRVKL